MTDEDRMFARMAESQARLEAWAQEQRESVAWHFAGMDFDAKTKTWHCKPGHWEAVQARQPESVKVRIRLEGV